MIHKDLSKQRFESSYEKLRDFISSLPLVMSDMVRRFHLISLISLREEKRRNMFIFCSINLFFKKQEEKRKKERNISVGFLLNGFLFILAIIPATMPLKPAWCPTRQVKT